MSHTPGPWKVSHDEHEPYWNIDMPMQDGSSRYGFCNAMVYTTEDDARLIAAAPELLDRLRECVTWLEEYYDAVSLDEDQEQHLQAARAAIAKAEGRSE